MLRGMAGSDIEPAEDAVPPKRRHFTEDERNTRRFRIPRALANNLETLAEELDCTVPDVIVRALNALDEANDSEPTKKSTGRSRYPKKKTATRRI
jgi:hypothetical protein